MTTNDKQRLPDSLSRVLRLRRLELGLTLTQMHQRLRASGIAVSESWLGRIERGGVPSLSVAVGIVAAYDLDARTAEMLTSRAAIGAGQDYPGSQRAPRAQHALTRRYQQALAELHQEQSTHSDVVDPMCATPIRRPHGATNNHTTKGHTR
jgi:transcriptional regulator with XRE-family HTH domain